MSKGGSLPRADTQGESRVISRTSTGGGRSAAATPRNLLTENGNHLLPGAAWRFDTAVREGGVRCECGGDCFQRMCTSGYACQHACVCVGARVVIVRVCTHREGRDRTFRGRQGRSWQVVQHRAGVARHLGMVRIPLLHQTSQYENASIAA